jgi:hypothetical protein
MTQTTPAAGSQPESASQDDDVAMPTPERAVRRVASEDWAATIVGLVLLGLAIAGVITKAMIP